MKNLWIFLYEWKHFTRSPFKIIALLLFMVASIYGLYKGEKLYHKQRAEVEKIEEKVKAGRQQQITAYQEGKLVPEDRTWIDFSTPFWAIEFSWIYHCKSPSPAMVYSIGQSEQYGFYKKITRWANPYDADLVEEIANPERLQTGTLDFAFALLFLSPLLLLVLLYNIKSFETEQGFISLIEVQSTSRNVWSFSRVLFYFLLVLLTTLLLISYGAMRTNVLTIASAAFGQMLFYSFAYLAFWSTLYFLVLNWGKSTLGNSLKMIGLYFVFAFIIPATVYQYLSIRHPVNLMTDLVDAKLDKRWKLWDQPDSLRLKQLNDLFPEIENSPLLKDSTRLPMVIRESTSALENKLKKASILLIEKENQVKNSFIKNTFWFNPVSFFQNRFNAVAQTHFDDYQNYRDEIQALVDTQIRLLVLDMWEDKKVDEQKYLEYYQLLTQLE